MAILRDAAKNLVYSRHGLPSLHCEVVVQFPLGNQISYSSLTGTPFFACWFKGTGSLYLPSSNLKFQVNEIIVVTPYRSISPFVAKILRPVDHKVMGIGSKTFTSGSLKIIVVPLPFPLLNSLGNPNYGNNSIIYWMWIQSIYRLLQNLVPAMQGIAT